MRRRFISVLAMVSILTSSLTLPFTATDVVANQIDDFAVTSIFRHCDSSILEVQWTGADDARYIHLSVFNTSDDWHDADWEPHTGTDGVIWELDHEAIDKVYVEVRRLDGSGIFLVYDVGACGQQGRLTSSTSVPADPAATILDWTCEGTLTVKLDPALIEEEYAILVDFGGGDVKFGGYHQPTSEGIISYTFTENAGDFGVVEVTRWAGDFISVLIDANDDWVGTDCTNGGSETPTVAPDPALEIDNVVLACDGLVTFSVVDPSVIKDGNVAYSTLFAGANILDQKAVTLVPGQANYSVQMLGSDAWPDDHLVRAQISWAPETQANGVVEPGSCATDVTPTETVPVVPTETPTVAPTETTTTVPTETATVAPTETIVPTERPTGSTVNITVTMPDGSSLEGAPWALYAPLMSQQVLPPYATGVVGAGNRIVIDDVPDGEYRLVISPEGREALTFAITVAVDSNGVQDIQLSLADPVPTATATTETVSKLPTTGTGTGGNTIWLGVSAITAMLLAGIGVASSRRRTQTT